MIESITSIPVNIHCSTIISLSNMSLYGYSIDILVMFYNGIPRNTRTLPILIIMLESADFVRRKRIF